MPDATTLLKFRRLLVEHALTRKLFDEIGIELCEHGLMMKEGTLVDATIFEAPPSTKNAGKSRDPEMHQAKKGKDWHFGMKAHVGVDADSGLVHSVVTTAANESDVSQAAPPTVESRSVYSPIPCGLQSPTRENNKAPGISYHSMSQPSPPDCRSHAPLVGGLQRSDFFSGHGLPFDAKRQLK